MMKEILYKWFGLDPTPCATCEVLKDSLAVERQMNKVLLDKLLDKGKPEPPANIEEQIPIVPKRIPWAVKRQQLEAEDKRAAQILRSRMTEINGLEKDLGIGPSETR